MLKKTSSTAKKTPSKKPPKTELVKVKLEYLDLEKINPFDMFHRYDPFTGFQGVDEKDTQDHLKGIEMVKELMGIGKRIRPILVQKLSEDYYQRLDGFKRYWAHKDKGHQKIWAFVTDKPLAGAQEGHSLEMPEDEWAKFITS